MALSSKQSSTPETFAKPSDNVSYVLVFVLDELQEFYWIAHVVGYDTTDYLIYTDKKYRLTSLGRQTTLSRLIFDQESPNLFHRNTR